MSEQYQDNWDAKPATDQEIARLRKIEKAARDLEKDLIDRAEWDGDVKTVCAGNGVWFRFQEALGGMK